jgi:hypothetical protein
MSARDALGARPIVFLGPSLPHAEAARLLDAELRPPAAAGDVLAAALRSPPAIVLIDGYFERVPAVWHKEILYAIEQGVPVYGASSMGALRAAELHSFGMIGVGRVFERYASGELEDDDEVAVVHGPAEDGYRPLSEAMVSLRDGLAEARDAGVIDTREHDLLVPLAKALFYPERVWPAVAAAGMDAGLERARMRALVAWAKATAPNTKRADAVRVLERVREDLAASVPREPPRFELERSVFWEQLVEAVAHRGASDVDVAAVTGWAKLSGPPTRVRGALLRHVARLEARRRGLTPHPQHVQAAFDTFRRQRDLYSVPQLEAWLQAQGLDFAGLVALITEEVLIEELLVAEARGVERALVDELKLEGAWATHVEQAAAQVAAARARGATAPMPSDVGLEPEALLAWYTAEHRPVIGELDAHARALGFSRASELWVALTRARLVAPSPVSSTDEGPLEGGRTT